MAGLDQPVLLDVQLDELPPQVRTAPEAGLIRRRPVLGFQPRAGGDMIAEPREIRACAMAVWRRSVMIGITPSRLATR